MFKTREPINYDHISTYSLVTKGREERGTDLEREGENLSPLKFAANFLASLLYPFVKLFKRQYSTGLHSPPEGIFTEILTLRCLSSAQIARTKPLVDSLWGQAREYKG